MHFELNDSQAVLNQKVNTLVTGLKEIDQLKRSGLVRNYFEYKQTQIHFVYPSEILSETLESWWYRYPCRSIQLH